MIEPGRVAIVSGGGRGLGRAIVLRLAAEGAHVAVLARSAGEVGTVAEKVTGTAPGGGLHDHEGLVVCTDYQPFVIMDGTRLEDFLAVHLA